MRGSGWLLPVAASLLWVAAVAWPIAAGALELARATNAGAEIRSANELLLTTVAWSSAVAFGSVLLGWAPGRWLGRLAARPGPRGARRFMVVAALMLAPICLPSYLAFWAWWQAWPPDSAIYGWAVEHGQIAAMRQATLWLGLLCWSWPLAAWCVAGWVAAIPAEHDEMLKLDGADRWTRILDRLRSDAGGLACGGLIVFLTTFNNTTSFDLAEVFTFANELRAVHAAGGSARDVLIAGLPAIAISAVGAAGAWWALSRRRSEDVLRSAPAVRATMIVSVVIWLLSVAVPLALVSGGALRRAKVGEFAKFYGEAMANTIMIAASCGILCALIACGLVLMWQDRRRWVRMLAHVQAVGWLVLALLPATLNAVAQEAAYNRGLLAEIVYQTPMILVLGHLAAFGFVAALLGRWAAQREPANVRDLRLLDGAQTLRGQLIAAAPVLTAAAVASAAIAGVLSLSEIVVSGQLAPPGFELLAPIVLNALHYQRPETVALATVATIGIALIAVLVAIASWGALRRISAAGIGRTASAGLLLLLALNGGCGGDVGLDAAQPLEPLKTFGVNGLSLGQFSYPRAIAVDPQRGFVYIVDKTARVQRFGLDGKPQLEWSMPEKEQGKPTGISVSPDGRVFVADTHYFRVMVYDSEGRELQRFGSYGTEPGQFIYPTDIAFGPGGNLYVSEYGGNDRVQVFSPAGEFLFQFGAPGEGEGQFTRPQSLAFSHDQRELFVADAINHRIVVTDPQGRWLRTLGGPGREPGRLNYPYGLTVLDDGTLLVAEFGGNRIQRFSPEGQPLEVYGRLGTKPGELRYPWAVAAAGDLVFVLDSGNNRVQVMESPR